MYYIRKHQPNLQNVVKRLQSIVNDVDEKERSILHREAIYPTAAGYLVFQSVIIISCIIYCFFPVGKNNLNQPLPVFAWYPNYMSVGYPYWIVYFFQEISIFLAGTLWVCVDLINFGLFAHHYVMLKILSYRIASHGWSALSTRNCENETRQIYSSILFAKITLSSIIICSFVYQLGFKPASYGGFVAQIAILGIIVSSLFLLSWITEKISATSYELMNKAAACNFIEMDHKTTKALIIFMGGQSNTIFVEVGSIFTIPLNLKTFVQIIDFAYKCLTLLKTAV